MSASSDITLTVGGTDYTVSCPLYGYASSIILSLIFSPLSPKGYGIWDNGATNDYRMLKCEFLLNETEMETLLNTFKDSNKGRGISVDMTLPSGSGFYPYCPDKGDAGTFQSRLIEIDPGNKLEEPYGWFRCAATFIAESFPSYSLPSQISEDDLKIGSIENLRYPPDGAKSKSNYIVNSQHSMDGTVSTIDKNYDAYSTILPMICNQSKSAALINHVVSSVRDSNVTIVAPSGYYLFGRDNSDSGTYTCQCLNDSMEVTHDAFDRFSFPLSFYLVSAA